jgi:glycosyltransferase involved in cell wall biosynthesis
MIKTKIIIIQRILSSYRKPIFDLLAQHYNLTVIHSHNKSGIKQIETYYSKTVRIFKYWKKETNVFLCCFYNLLQIKPNVVIHEFNPSIISLYIVLLLKGIFSCKVILWGHGFNQKKRFDPLKDLSSKFRMWLINRSDAVLLYGNNAKCELSKYVNSDKMFVAYNSLDTVDLQNIKLELDQRGVDNIKEEISINEKYNLIFVGRMLYDKVLPESFIKIILNLSLKLESIGFHFIGDGEATKSLKEEIKNNNLDNVYIHGSIHDDLLLGKYLYVSDLLLNPGYLGLSVNHALAFGTPVVSFARGEKGPYHSPEVEYVIDGKTGFLIEDYNIDAICDRIIVYLQDDDLKFKMKKEIMKMNTSQCNINKMFEGFKDAINYVTK